MRSIVDGEVKKLFENKPLEAHRYSELKGMYPGTVEKTNEFNFLPTNKIQQETIREKLLSAMTRMPGSTNKEKYCFAMISLANLGSVYLTTAIQYALYSVLTSETKPVKIEEFIKDAGQAHILDVLDLTVLNAFVKDILKGYESLEDVKASGNLVDIAISI